jgi:hypothetical protein
LSGFDASDPRDTINALWNICREVTRPYSTKARRIPIADYGRDLFEVYSNFVKVVIESSASLDIICRFWASRELKTRMPTTPRLVKLPSWIKLAEDSAWGQGEDLFNGRQAGDSFVGLPDDHNYHASGIGADYKRPEVQFPEPLHLNRNDPATALAQNSAFEHDTSIIVRGVTIGRVSYHTEPSRGIITKECLKRLGWSFDCREEIIPEVHKRLWQTLVADRHADNQPLPGMGSIVRPHCNTAVTASTLTGF